jgi:hypothetical protein
VQYRETVATPYEKTSPLTRLGSRHALGTKSRFFTNRVIRVCESLTCLKLGIRTFAQQDAGVRSVDSRGTSHPSLLPPQAPMHRGRCRFCSRPFPSAARRLRRPWKLTQHGSAASCSRAAPHMQALPCSRTCRLLMRSLPREASCRQSLHVRLCSCRLCHQTSGKRLLQTYRSAKSLVAIAAQVRALERPRSQPGCCYREHRNFAMRCPRD